MSRIKVNTIMQNIAQTIEAQAQSISVCVCAFGRKRDDVFAADCGHLRNHFSNILVRMYRFGCSYA